MESRHDSVLRSRCSGIPKFPSFSDLDGTLDKEPSRREHQEDDGDKPVTTSNGEKSPHPSSAGSAERTLTCCCSDIWKGILTQALPPLFYFPEWGQCVMRWFHCVVTCGSPGQKPPLSFISTQIIILCCFGSLFADLPCCNDLKNWANQFAIIQLPSYNTCNYLFNVWTVWPTLTDLFFLHCFPTLTNLFSSCF